MAYRFECPRENCRFALVADGDDEVARLARAHARVAHSSRFAWAELERRIDRVELA